MHLQKFFSEDHDEMVIVKDIPLYSMCEHHLLPFYGKAHVAYIPRKAMLPGVEAGPGGGGFAKRPQLQERLTSQVADAIMHRLNPIAPL